MTGTVLAAVGPISYTLAKGFVAPGIYTGPGSGGAPDTSGSQVDPGISADSVIQFQIPIPATAPSGVLNLRCVMVTDDTTIAHSALFTISDAAISAGASASATTLTAETPTVMHPAATAGISQVTDVPLTHSTPTADQFVIVIVTFTAIGWTTTNIATFQFFAVWK